jgi:hypothetical protein
MLAVRLSLLGISTLRPRPPRFRRLARLAACGLVLLCLAAVAVWPLSNLTLSSGPARLDQLDALDKVRLAEVVHLRLVLGESMWPGFSQAAIPIVLWNHAYEFLVGLPNPPADWEPVPADLRNGASYYLQPARNPQNFAVRVDDQWVASLATKWKTDQFLIGKFREKLPGPLGFVFPYRLLIQNSAVQMVGMVHKSFHVYQAQVAPGRFTADEAVHQRGDAYWEQDAALRADWEREGESLAQALAATSVD